MGGTYYTRTQSKTHGVSIDISAAYHADSGEFLDQIIAGEETWVVHITPEHKAKRMQSALIFLQHIKLTVTNFWTWSPQAKKRVAHITLEHKAKRMQSALLFMQHIMLTVTSFWTRSSQVK